MTVLDPQRIHYLYLLPISVYTWLVSPVDCVSQTQIVTSEYLKPPPVLSRTGMTQVPPPGHNRNKMLIPVYLLTSSACTIIKTMRLTADK